ncbi:hypothetical protein [Enterovibrio calviensis]|nr:hypothetical protein [Enterovibrio calviensis]
MFRRVMIFLVCTDDDQQHIFMRKPVPYNAIGTASIKALAYCYNWL